MAHARTSDRAEAAVQAESKAEPIAEHVDSLMWGEGEKESSEEVSRCPGGFLLVCHADFEKFQSLAQECEAACRRIGKGESCCWLPRYRIPVCFKYARFWRVRSRSDEFLACPHEILSSGLI